MRVLTIHNSYHFRGGEDVVFEAEAELLRDAGHDVTTWRVEDAGSSGLSRVQLGINAVWSRGAASEVARRVAACRAEVVHFHNVQPMLSLASVRAARAAGAATVMTLHNWRMVCPGATRFRNGQPCEKCVGGWGIEGVRRGCYRGSRAGTLSVALGNAVHDVLGTLDHHVDAFICLTRQGRNVFERGGLPAGRLHVKPNFLRSDPGPGGEERRGAIFVGRLTQEKGVKSLAAVAAEIAPHPLTIVGDGPLLPEIEQLARQRENVVHHRCLSHDQTVERIKQAAVVVFPSVWPEPFGLVLIEAAATATPVVGRDIGSVPDIVDDGVTGRIVPAGDDAALAGATRRLLDDPAHARRLGIAARQEFLAKYTADANRVELERIYGVALSRRCNARRAA